MRLGVVYIFKSREHFLILKTSNLELLQLSQLPEFYFCTIFARSFTVTGMNNKNRRWENIVPKEYINGLIKVSFVKNKVKYMLRGAS